MDIPTQIAVNNYKALGFPVQLIASDKSNAAIVNYPGWGAGYFVIDVDAHKNGLQTLKELQKNISFPKTVLAKTQHGGYHFYFKYPDNLTIKSQINVWPGIDILSEDSRVTMPPTLGRITGSRYEWVNDPFLVPMAAAPQNLLTVIGEKI